MFKGPIKPALEISKINKRQKDGNQAHKNKTDEISFVGFLKKPKNKKKTNNENYVGFKEKQKCKPGAGEK